MRYQFDNYCFDAENVQLSGPDGVIPLRPMTLSLLGVLLQEAPQLLRHDALLDKVWGRQAVSVGVVSQSIRELRQALGDSAKQPRFIETKHRLGYRFIAELSVDDESGSETNQVPGSTAHDATPDLHYSRPQPAARKSGRAPIWIGGIALLLLGSLAYLGMQRSVEPGIERDNIEIIHSGRPTEPQALAWYRQGMASLKEGRLAQAREQLQASLSREPDAAASMAALGDVLAHAGVMTEARKWASSAEQAARGLPRLEQLRMAAFRAGLEYRWDDALASLQALSKINPGDVESGRRLVEAELASGRLQSAQNSLERLESIKTPSLDRYHLEMLRARLAAARGDHVARLAAARAAAGLADNRSERIDAGLEKAWALLLQGAKDEARSELELAASALEHDTVTLQQLKVAMLRSTMLRESGEYPAAMSGFAQAAEDAAALGQDSLAAQAKREAAFVQVQAGDPGAAAAALDQVIDDLQQHGDVRELASAQDVLSLAQQRAGDLAAAQLAGKAALDAYIRVGDRAGEASARNQLGMLYARAGRSDEAREHFENAQGIFAAQGNRRGAATALSNLAILHGRAGKAEAAREAEESALVEFREIGALAEVARLQFNMAVRDRGAGQLEDASKRFREALDAFTRIGAVDFARQATASLAELLMLRADLAEAEAVLQRQPDAPNAGVLPRTALITARARLALLRGDFESAESRYREAKALREKAGLGDWARMSELDLAEMDAARGRWGLAEQSARKQRREMHTAKDNMAALQAGVLVATSLAAQGRKGATERLLETLDTELTKYPDALQSLRIDFIRADMRTSHRGLALQQVAGSARSKGYEMLALRAELLGDDAMASVARAELERRGVKLSDAPVVRLD